MFAGNDDWSSYHDSFEGEKKKRGAKGKVMKHYF